MTDGFKFLGFFRSATVGGDKGKYYLYHSGKHEVTLWVKLILSSKDVVGGKVLKKFNGMTLYETVVSVRDQSLITIAAEVIKHKNNKGLNKWKAL